MTKLRIAVVLCGGALTAAAALGQAPAPPEKPGPHRLGPMAQRLIGEDWQKRDVQELVEIVMMVRLSQELDLSEERTVVMVRRFQEFKERLKEVSEKRREALKELKDAVRAGEPDDIITAKLDALMALDRELLTMKQRAFEKVSAELTPVQRAKLYVFLQDFEGQLRRLVERARRGASGPENPPYGPGRMGPPAGARRFDDRTGPARPRRFGGPGRGPDGEAPAPGTPPDEPPPAQGAP